MAKSKKASERKIIKTCKMSEEGFKENIFSRRKMCEGIIVGETRDGKCYRVVWPGSKTPTSYHKSYIEIIVKEAMKF